MHLVLNYNNTAVYVGSWHGEVIVSTGLALLIIKQNAKINNSNKEWLMDSCKNIIVDNTHQ